MIHLIKRLFYGKHWRYTSNKNWEVFEIDEQL